MSVPARISIVTLGVDDVARSKAFYEALGWEVAGTVGDEICWFRTADSYLGLFDRESLARDAGLRSEPTAEFGGITLAINVESEAAVDAAFEAAAGAGARILKPAEANRLGRVFGLLRRSGRAPVGGRPQPELPHRRRRPHHHHLRRSPRGGSITVLARGLVRKTYTGMGADRPILRT